MKAAITQILIFGMASLIFCKPQLYAQSPAVFNDTTFVLTKVGELKGQSQLKIFARANEYLVENGYTKSKSFVAENSDGKISCRILLFVAGKGPLFPTTDYGNVVCRFEVIAKDDKYKVILSSFQHDSGGFLSKETPAKGDILTAKMPKKKWLAVKAEAKELAFMLVESFTKFMNKINADYDF